MGMAALAVDVGNAYYQRSGLEKSTDLAALAAAQKMKTSDNASEIQAVAYNVFSRNGLDPEQANITVNVSKGSETAFVDSTLNVPFYFAKVLGFDDLDVNAQAVAELLPDGSSRLVDGNTYDLVPWGIPHGETTFDPDNVELDIDGTSIYDWQKDPNFQFQVGSEYLLKLGEGQSGDAIGRKILIPMDGSEDVYPNDDDDPIFPELGNRIQSQYLEAYGLVYWCLKHGYHVDWLLDYDGGSFLVDYHDEINNAVSETGIDLSGVSKIVLNASHAAQLNNWLAANKNSEGRPYEIVPMDNPFQIAVFTQNVYQPGDLMPWGMQKKTDSYPFGYEVGTEYVIKYGSGSASGHGQGNFGALAMGGNGANVYRDNIINGVSNPNGSTYYVGKQIYTEPGNMSGPTMQGLQSRIDNNKLYFRVPVVSYIKINGRSSRTTIYGFLNFKLNSVDSNKGWVYAKLVDKIPPEELNYTVNEDLNNEIVAKAMNLAGIPFDWIHDEDAYNGNINNYDWIYTHHEDFYDDTVAVRIAEWVAAGHYFFDMCWATDRFDNAIEQYNHDTFGSNTDEYIPTMFFKSHDTIQYSRCYRCSHWNGDSDCCFYSGWVREYVVHTDVNSTLNQSYTISPRDIMQTQNHVTTVTSDGMIGRTHNFNRSAIKDEYSILAADNSAQDHKQGIIAYMNGSTAKMLTREYKIHPDDVGGWVTFYGGHDPARNKSNIPAYRLILNNVLAGSQAPAVNRNAITNFGALDLNSQEEAEDEQQYLANVKYGYQNLLYPGVSVDTLIDNMASSTNTGVSFNINGDTHVYPDVPSDSSRIVLVPIVSVFNEDGSLICAQQDNIDEDPKCIYGYASRDKVRIIGIAKFWLLDCQSMDTDDLDIDRLGPVENGQVRGIFLGYFIAP